MSDEKVKHGIILIEFSTICCVFVCFKFKLRGFNWMNWTMWLKTVFSFANVFTILRLQNLSNKDMNYTTCLKDIFGI